MQLRYRRPAQRVALEASRLACPIGTLGEPPIDQLIAIVGTTRTATHAKATQVNHSPTPSAISANELANLSPEEQRILGRG